MKCYLLRCWIKLVVMDLLLFIAIPIKFYLIEKQSWKTYWITFFLFKDRMKLLLPSNSAMLSSTWWCCSYFELIRCRRRQWIFLLDFKQFTCFTTPPFLEERERERERERMQNLIASRHFSSGFASDYYVMNNFFIPYITLYSIHSIDSRMNEKKAKQNQWHI